MRFIISRRLRGARRAFLPSRSLVNDDPLRCCYVLAVPATTSFRQLLRAGGIRRRSLFRSLSPFRSRPTHTRWRRETLLLSRLLSHPLNLFHPLSQPHNLSFTLSLSLSHSSHTLSLSLPLTLSLSFSLFLPLSYARFFGLLMFVRIYLLRECLPSSINIFYQLR